MISVLPYPGLRPFHPDESDIFFGREEQTDDLLRKLGTTRFLSVTGPSGCGKSSLVLAGMIPALETGFMARAGSRWRISIMRPGSQPIANLSKALVKAGLGPQADSQAVATGFLSATLRRGPLGLAEVLRESPLPERTNLLVLVDQFEELLRFHRLDRTNEADAFVRLLLESAAQREAPIYVVITMRSDYLGDCAVFQGLPEILNQGQYLTPRLTREQRRLAILSPARVFGGDVEPDLINRLLNESGNDPDQLPVLQHLLMRMWTYQEPEVPTGEHPADQEGDETSGAAGRTLTMHDYEEVGGLAGALSKHANEAFAALSNNRRQEIAKLMFRRLSERGEDRRDVRRPTPVGEIQAVADCALGGVSLEEVCSVADVFRAPRYGFLVPSYPETLDAESVLDITHESLIRRWDRLDEWSKEEAESARNYRYLEQGAQRWRKGKGNLWRGLDLEGALSWRNRERPSGPWASRYGADFDLAMRFLDGSLRRKTRLRALITVGIAAVVLVFGASCLLLIQWTNARSAAAIRSAAAAEDPLVRALVVGKAGYSAGAEQAISEVVRVATASIPMAVLGDRTRQAQHQDLIGAWFEPGADRVVTVSKLGAVRRWPSNGRGNPEAFPFQVPSRDLSAVALSRDQQWLAAGFESGGGWIGRSHGAGSSEIPKLDREQITSLAFSPDGGRIIAGYANSTVRMWNREGALLRELGDPKVHGGSISAVQFDLAGKRAVTASWNGTANVWDLEQPNNPIAALGQPRPEGGKGSVQDPVGTATFSPDGNWVICGYWSGKVLVWRSDGTGEPVELNGHAGIVTSIASVSLDHENLKVVTGSADRTARIWNLRSQTAQTPNAPPIEIGTSTVLGGHLGGVRAVAFDTSGSRIVTASEDGTARIWWSESQEPRILGRHENRIESVAFAPDGNRVISASDDRTARVWTLDRPNESVVLKHDDWVRSAAFSYDGKGVVTGSEDGTFCVWDLANGANDSRREDGAVLSAAFTQDGKGVLTATKGNSVRLWPIGTSKDRAEPQLAIRDHTGWVWRANFSPDRSKIVTASADNTAKIWAIDSNGRASILRVLQHNERVLDAAFSPDGKFVATASADRLARIWNMEGVALKEFPHFGEVWQVAFSSDGKLLITASTDGTAVIWDTDSGAADLVLTHPSGVRAASFPPKGTRYVVTGADDGRVRVWRISARDLIVEYLSNASTACLTPQERVRFFRESLEKARSKYQGCEAEYGRTAPTS